LLLSASILFFVYSSGLRFSFTFGISMEPTWKEHNFIWGHVPKSIDEIHVGDIIAFHFNGKVVVHRVTEFLGDYIIAYGDNKEVCLNGQAIHFKDIIFVVDGQRSL
jgi:hypothetical protein